MPEATEGIELKLKTGEVIKAPSVEEALKIAVKMSEDTKEVYHQEKQAREQLEQQVAELASQVQKANAPPPPKPGDFNKDEYYRLLNADPIAAQNFLDSYRFGQDPVSYFQRVDKQMSEMQMYNLTGQFLAQHGQEFPADKKNADIFGNHFNELVKQGHPADMSTMELTWQQVTNAGLIKPLEPKQEDIEREEPNPSLRGGGHDIPDTELQKAENMSTPELEKYLREKGLL